MERVVRNDESLLAFSLSLTPQDRLRQANAAFRLYYTLHRPYAKPFVKGFDRHEDYLAFTKENDLPG